MLLDENFKHLKNGQMLSKLPGLKLIAKRSRQSEVNATQNDAISVYFRDGNAVVINAGKQLPRANAAGE